MAAPQTRRKEKRNYDKHQVRCNQVNLKHSKAATDNFMKGDNRRENRVALIQEPYLFQGTPLRIIKRYITFIAGEGNSRVAIVVSDTIDALLITQLSDDAVLLKTDNGQTLLRS